MTANAGSSGPRAFLRRFWRELSVVVALLVGITVLLTFAGLGPRPPPPATGGEIEVTDMVRNLSQRDHLEDAGLPTDGYSADELGSVLARKRGPKFDTPPPDTG